MPVIKSLCLCTFIFLLIGCTNIPVIENSSVDESAAVDESASVDESEPGAEGSAVIEIDFIESAPKDRFVIKNLGSCELSVLTVELDLAQSAGALIFDITESGAGVEVFQPFEVVDGDITQISADGVADGDSQLALRIANLGPSGSASFTIDVDDTLPAGELGQIRVSGSEISGGLVTITVGELEPATANFDDGSRALVRLPACP